MTKKREREIEDVITALSDFIEAKTSPESYDWRDDLDERVAAHEALKDALMKLMK